MHEGMWQKTVDLSLTPSTPPRPVAAATAGSPEALEAFGIGLTNDWFNQRFVLTNMPIRRFES